MPRSYKLRLGDGTTLAVDHGSLATWLVDPKAMVQEDGKSQWYSLHEYLQAERVAARRAARKAPSGGPLPLVPPPPKDQPIRRPEPTPSPRDALPLIPPPPKDQPIRRKDAETPPPTPPADTAVPLLTFAEALAPEPPAPAPMPGPAPVLALRPASLPVPATSAPAVRTPPPPRAPVEPEPVVVKVLDVRVVAEETAPAFEASPQRGPTPDDSAPPIALSPVEEPEAGRGLPSWERPQRASPVAATPDLNVLADDPLAATAERARPPTTPDDSLAIIPLKPNDSYDRMPADEKYGVWPEADPGHDAGSDEARLRDLEIEELLSTPVVAFLLRAAAVLGGLLSKGLDGLARVGRERRARPAAAPTETHSALAGLLQRGRDAAGRLQQQWQSRHAPTAPTTVATSGAAPTPAVPRAVPPRELSPPPPLAALPALRLLEIEESQDPEDVYDGSDWGGTLLPALWLWTKRLVLVGVLVVGGALAAVHWETWFPRAGELGQQTLSEIDRRARSADLAREEQRLLQVSAEQLPQLAPATARLLLSRAPGGVLAAPALFRRACDAADRGLAALSAEESTELAQLREQVMAPLRPEERERVRAYDRARASGAVFPFDDRSVLDLVGGGARTLAPERLERLQVLLGKAIAAGLAPATASADTPPR